MVTYFVIYDTFTRSFARAGRAIGWTLAINNAKHFTSKWSAENYMQNYCADSLSSCKICRIERY